MSCSYILHVACAGEKYVAPEKPKTDEPAKKKTKHGQDKYVTGWGGDIHTAVTRMDHDHAWLIDDVCPQLGCEGDVHMHPYLCTARLSMYVM